MVAFSAVSLGDLWPISCILDITYQSLATAFNQPLEHHTEALRRMTELIKHRTDLANQTPEQRTARERMALFPAQAEVLFIAPDVWVVSAPLLLFTRSPV